MIVFLSIVVLTSSVEKLFDIEKSSVSIYSAQNEEAITILYQNINTTISKLDTIVISGQTNLNNIFVVSHDVVNPVNIKLQNLHISNENNIPIFIQNSGKCTVRTVVDQNVELVSKNNHSIFISGVDSIFQLEGGDDHITIRLDCGFSTTSCQLISSDGSITLKNVDISKSSINGGIIGENIALVNCDISFSSVYEVIGGLQCSSIFIQKCKLILQSQISSCIGNIGNNKLDIFIEDSIIEAHSLSGGAGIGNKQYFGQIAIKKSALNVSSHSTFAAIGWSHEIIIEYSEIDAKAHKSSAIGGVNIVNANCQIEITECTINATSDGNSATIGGGETFMYVTIDITNSRLNVLNSALAGREGAGIGGGSSNRVDHITIHNCTITSVASCSGQGIGSGGGDTYSMVYNITITKSKILAINNGTETQFSGAGIGGYIKDRLLMKDSEIEAHSGHNGAGIGGGASNPVKAIVIINCTVNAFSKNTGAAIGGCSHGFVELIMLNNSKIYAFAGRDVKGAVDGAGIGGGYFTHSENIMIISCNVTAISGWTGSGAGIGGGQMGSAGHILIEGSNVVAISSLNATLYQHGNNGGAGIGAGGSTNLDTGRFFNNGSITIKNSNVSAFGSNIHTAIYVQYPNKLPLVCGAGIGHGGCTPYPRFPSEVLNITIENSEVYAFGGNATLNGSAASAAIVGGLLTDRSKEGVTIITGSKIYALSGKSIFLNKKKAAIGWNYDPQEGVSGDLVISNSQIYTSHIDDDNMSVSIIMKKVTLDSDVELHSTTENPIIAKKKIISMPLITLSGFYELQPKEFTITNIRNNAKVKTISVDHFDNSVSFSIKSAGKYRVGATINGEKFTFVNEDSSYDFDIYVGSNFINISKLSYENDDQIIFTTIPPKKPKQNMTVLYICLAVGIPVAMGVIIFLIAVFLILKKKKDPLTIADVMVPSYRGMSDALNEGEMGEVP